MDSISAEVISLPTDFAWSVARATLWFSTNAMLYLEGIFCEVAFLRSYQYRSDPVLKLHIFKMIDLEFSFFSFSSGAGMYVRYFVPRLGEDVSTKGVWLRRIIGVFSGNNKDIKKTDKNKVWFWIFSYFFTRFLEFQYWDKNNSVEIFDYLLLGSRRWREMPTNERKTTQQSALYKSKVYFIIYYFY